jgi:hypothetical protein
VSFNNRLLLETLDDRWIGEDYAMFKYLPQRYGDNEARRLILAFKENESDAVRVITQLFIRMMTRREPQFRDQIGARFIVSLPRSAKGPAGPAAEQLCSALGAAFGWLTHLPGAFIRTESVKKSAGAPRDSRPNLDTHVNSIKYVGPRIDAATHAILMFDDVVTLQSTSQACRTLLQRSTHAVRVPALFIGRTVWY